MAYQVKYTEETNTSKQAILVEDQSLNIETDLTFVGKNYSSYGPILAENFLHLLENFANSTAPLKPIQGQLWYDNATNVNLLKVYDGTSWTAAGSVKKSSSAPLVQNSVLGDLWVDTTNQQLYLFSGSTWLLIGPQYSSGLKTGQSIEVLVDTDNFSHGVIVMYANNVRVSIISNDSFIPKTNIAGFTTINPGINLSTFDLTTKFQGTATQADALMVNGKSIPAANFLRSDITVPTNTPLSIRTNDGINIGSDLSFSIRTDSNTTSLISKTSGKSIDIRVNDTTTILHLDTESKVGINKIAPTEALDVEGNIATNGIIKVTSTQESTAIGIGSIVTTGGLSVDLKSNLKGDVSLYGILYLNKLNSLDAPIAGSVILPGYTTSSPATTPLYDIGSVTQQFRNVYAQQFAGNFSGVLVGSLTGDITGSATKLKNPTAFSLSGDVTSAPVTFNGQTTNGTAIFATTISPNIITNRDVVTSSQLDDAFLMYRSGTSPGLKQISKQQFIENIPTVPVGAIFPFAGTTPPTGYLLCDGGEILVSEYQSLYNVIRYVYKDATLLVGLGTFAVPDLRGRFALGRDNMDNGTTVPSKSDSTKQIDAGGGSADRVTNVSADVLGNTNGAETHTLDITNIPEHTHNMKSVSGQQYYASGIPGGATDPTAEPQRGMPNTSTGYGMRNSGGIDVPVNTTMKRPFDIMNPYLSINYIIFTGKLQ